MLHKIQSVTAQGILPLFYHDDPDVCLKIIRALYKAGIRAVEFTNRGPKALANFRQLVQLRDTELQDLLLAVGTVRSAEDADAFCQAGADLLISPVFDEGVCTAARERNIPWIPGCLTPTEIHRALGAGCTLVKIFPGNLTGPSYIDAIRPLFPEVQYLVTGGVEATEENFRAWFKSGVAGVGLGSKLIPSGTVWNDVALEKLELDARSALSIWRVVSS